MMAEKARLFGDAEAEKAILDARDPKTAKALGRGVQGFDGAVWDSECRGIVTQGNVEKFGKNKSLREYLLGTAGKLIVEASPYDRIWGIGLKQSDKRATNPLESRGTTCSGSC